MRLTLAIVLLLLAGLAFTACKDTPNDMDDIVIYPVDTLTYDVAKGRVDAFAAIVASEPDKEFSFGFNLSHGDIQALYKDNDTTNQDTVYAMIGYDAAIDSFDLIFCIETPKNSGHYIYVDFTQPCPSFCPGYLDPTPTASPLLDSLNGNTGFWFGREGMTAILSIGTDNGEESYLMFKNGDWDQGVYLVVCPDDCDNPDDENAYFAPCGIDGQPTCYQF